MTNVEWVMDEGDVAAVVDLLAARPEPPTREGILGAVERAPEDTTLLGRRTRTVWLRRAQLGHLRSAADDYLSSGQPIPATRGAISRLFARLWAENVFPTANHRARFFERARLFSPDSGAVDRAEEFLDFKIRAAQHAREEILMVLNRGVTTYQRPTDPVSAQPSGLVRETYSLIELFRLRLSLDLLLFELAGLEDAVLQAVNVGFNLAVEPTKARHETVSAELRKALERAGLPSVVRESTGLEAWRDRSRPDATRVGDLRALRNQATHRHLVKMREVKPWNDGTLPAPVEPGKLRSEFYVDLGPGRDEPLDTFAGLTVDHVVQLVTASCGRLADLLGILTEYYGGALAVARRRSWGQARSMWSCSHGIVEPCLGGDGADLDPYFCSQCGVRIDDPAGKHSPDGSMYL